MGLTFKLGTAAQVTTNYIPKANSNSFSNSLIFDNGSNIGIGASSFPTSSNRLLFLNAPSGAAAQFLLGEAGTSYAYLYGYGGDAGLFTSAAIPLIFGTNNTERMRITSGGSVLINRSTNPYESVYKFIINNGTNLNIGFGKQEGEMSIEGFNDAINASIPLRIYGNPIKLMTTTSVISDLYVGGQAYKPGGGSWANSSDIRLKENVKTIDNALDKVLQLRGVTFDWKEGYTEFGKKESAGFIADEVMGIFPEWVSETNASDTQKEIIQVDKIKSLSLPFHFDALLVEAIKELSAKVSALENKS